MNPQHAPSKLKAPAKPGARRLPLFAACFALLAVLGWIDYVTGYELGFFVFYSGPIGLAAWCLGRWPAVMVSFGASITWWLADFYSGARYSAPFYYYWNGAIHFSAFLINAVTIAKIKSDLDRRHVLARELESARKALAAVATLLPACPACGKPRENTGARQDAALTPGTQLHAEFQSVLCSDCRERLQQRATLPPAAIPQAGPGES